MNLIYYPNSFLDKQVSKVDIENPEMDLQDIKRQMLDVMLTNNGIGLAANQVGLDAQIFIMGDSKRNCTLCVNPTVLQHTEDKVSDIEGCLSFPGIQLRVTRPKEILVKFWDENLEEQVTKIGDYSAKCFLHEWDHLQGITFKDRVSKLKWDIACRKQKKAKNTWLSTGN